MLPSHVVRADVCAEPHVLARPVVTEMCQHLCSQGQIGLSLLQALPHLSLIPKLCYHIQGCEPSQRGLLCY